MFQQACRFADSGKLHVQPPYLVVLRIGDVFFGGDTAFSYLGVLAVFHSVQGFF